MFFWQNTFIVSRSIGGISANVNRNFGLSTTYSFTNSRLNTQWKELLVSELGPRTRVSRINLLKWLFLLRFSLLVYIWKIEEKYYLMSIILAYAEMSMKCLIASNKTCILTEFVICQDCQIFFGSDTKIGPWFWFPIPKPGFGRTPLLDSSKSWMVARKLYH